MSAPSPDTRSASAPAAIVTVGSFDGVHMGHQDVIRRLLARAVEVRLAPVVVTFDPHPLEVVRPADAPPLLTTADERAELIAALGVERIEVLPFTPALAALGAEEFVDQVLRERFAMRELLIGYDHGFGKGRSGDVDTLRELGASRGFAVDVVPPVTWDDGTAVSSSSIRRAIAAGELDRAAVGLGRRYAATGRVVSGARRGRLLGYPTVNVELPSPRKLLPPHGVYAVRVAAPSGPYDGMMNLGGRPTFGETTLSLEAHLFGAAGDFYGAAVRVEFVARLRDVIAFPTAEALVAQLGRDAEAARTVLAALR
ncbi:MAG: bifunctional riboflavin kinase/FAD synthetase [Gemmatimonadaceae bacterium]